MAIISFSVARWSPLPMRINELTGLPKYTGFWTEEGICIANTFLPSTTCLFIENERRILNFWERTAPAKSCSSFSIFSTPCISKTFPFCFMPSTIHPPEVFANALTVSQMFFGRADFASFTSKSSHSISCKRPINSSFVISFSL